MNAMMSRRMWMWMPQGGDKDDDGEDGADGEDGEDGEDEEDGEDGEDGCDIEWPLPTVGRNGLG